MAALVHAQRPVPTPIFLLWSRSLHLQFQHWLPLDRVEGRDKLALSAGGQDKRPPVTPLEWQPRHKGLCPWERQEEATPWEGVA